MNDNTIKSLLISIKNCIKKLVDGEFTYDEAKGEYKKLKINYSEIKKDFSATAQNGFIKGLLYHHNINNFSKLTALYLFSLNELIQIDYYGDSKFGSILEDHIKKNIHAGSDEHEIRKILLDDKSDLPYFLYFQIINYDDEIRIISASVSSSQYFVSEKFNLLNALISLMFKKYMQIWSTGSIDYFNILSKKIINFINNKPSTIAYLFIFHSIKEIFHNAAISKYTDISLNIQNTLKKHFRNNSKIFVLSLTQYLILYPEVESEEKNLLPQGMKLNFFYNDLLIPYEKIKIETTNVESIYKFWNEIFLINNYVASGDIRL